MTDSKPVADSDQRDAYELAAEAASMEAAGEVPRITSRAEARAACERAAGLYSWRDYDLTYWTLLAYRASTLWTRQGWKL